jgi:REP element-mobilizing transposase RayT
MARSPRLTEDGLVYHAINRGNNRADVFTDDGDREAFLESLHVARSRYGAGPK